MGQRLNIQIEMDISDSNERKVLANAYYHWSGYTSSAYELVKKITDSDVYNLDILDPVEKAIRILEVTGAGLCPDELTDTYNTPEYKLTTGRNSGLIAISEEGIKNTVDWEEARVTINLSTNMVDMGGVYWIEDGVDEEEETTDDIPELKHDLYTSIYEFNKVYNEFHEKVESKNKYKVIDTDKQVLGVIG